MNKVLLIDGENAVHSVSHILKSTGLIKSRKELKKIHFDTLLQAVGKIDSIRYYSTRIQIPNKKNPLARTVENMRQWNSYWIPYIANQKVQIVKAGLLKVRDGKKCQKCGHKTEILIEKGVDVRLGVDIISLATKTATIHVLSSDSDLIPAINAAKKSGTRIVYVAFEESVNRALSKCSSDTIIIKKQDVKQAFQKVNHE